MDFRPAMRATTGIGRYVGGLSAALAGNGCDLRLFGVFFRGNRREARSAPPGARLVAWPVPSRVMDKLGWAGLTADRVVGGCDLFHHTNYIMAVVRRRTPQVMTIHDLAFLRAPSCHTSRACRALGRIVRRAVEQCAAFAVPSIATALDCETLLGLSRDRVFVTPLGVERSFFGLEPARPRARPYLLAVGTIEPRKNHARLIEAFRVDADLLVAGGAGWLCDDVVAAAAKRDNVHLLGHVTDGRLRELMAGAEAVLYPSLLEGFGLPVLEAMAAGKPVLTSDVEPLRSLAVDAALLVDPTDTDALSAGIERILHDTELRAALARAGPERARSFSWEACAQATHALYEAVLP